MIISFKQKRLLVKIRRFFDDYDTTILSAFIVMGVWVFIQLLLDKFS